MQMMAILLRFVWNVLVQKACLCAGLFVADYSGIMLDCLARRWNEVVVGVA
jgi:hypothetical protein